MNLINQIKLSIFYSDFKRNGIDSKLLEEALSDKNFSKIYKEEIVGFIKHLKNFSVTNFANGTATVQKLDEETITHHLNAILKTYRGSNPIKYISFVQSNSLESKKIENAEVLNDRNFDQLFQLVRNDVFSDNIKEIVTNGYSERLLQLISKYPKVVLQNIDASLFEDKVWNTIHSNYLIGTTPIFEMFNTKQKTKTLVELIQKDLLNGLKYTYENIPESHHFITNQLENLPTLEQFNMNFITNIGQDALKKLYLRDSFFHPLEYQKIFQIASCGNFELIQDIVNCSNDFYFANIKEEDIQKPLLEISNLSHLDHRKREILLNKFFGIDLKDTLYIELFLSAIHKTKLPDEFQEKYGPLLTLLNQIYHATDEEIIEMSHKLNKEKKEEYRKTIYECEKDGNQVIREQFSRDLEEKNREILNTATHNILTDKNGTEIDVYELDGQPFTMLVHAIRDNSSSSNNAFVSQLIENPAIWNEITDGNKHISTSLISDQYMVTYGTPNDENSIMFGFYKVPSQSIKFTSASDAGSSRNADVTDMEDYNMRNRVFFPWVNTVTTVDDLMAETVKRGEGTNLWNEVGLSRTDETTGDKLQPNYIVCMDHISEASKRAAECFHIPIYFIKRNAYQKSPNIVENHETLSETNPLETGHTKR